ncbi:MAG: hypothetical protein HFJ29_07610 [Clostridia bacterium]|nr:hypothetical protein [Clostridia bacterium]
MKKKLKLVNKNGETILMTKEEYLELAWQKGWNVKIPQLEDGTYDCDVFGGDTVHFHASFVISGTLCLENYALFDNDVSAQSGIILKDNASTYDLSSINGDVIIGNNASTCAITGKNVICGDNLDTNTWNISATDGFVILGKNNSAVVNDDDYDDDDYGISATEDIICDDEPSAESN